MFGTIRRMRAVIIKEFKHIWFDPGFLFLTVLSPAVLLMLLAYIFTFDIDHANLIVYDRDQTPASTAFIRSISATDDVTLLASVDNIDEIAEYFQRNEAEVGIIIPPGFEDALNAGESAPINLVVDGSDASTGIANQATMLQRAASYSAELTGLGDGGFEVRARVWFNENIRSQFSMIPGLMSIVLIMPALALALGITREKETGTFETLITTPILGVEYLLGKLVVYLLMGVIGTLLALAVAVFWFHVPFRGSLPLYLLTSLVYMLALMSISLVVAHITGTQRTAMTVVILMFFIPGFFLTGLITPVDASSQASYLASLSMPGTHFIVISRGIALKASTLNHIGGDVLFLLVTAILALTTAIVIFRKKL